MWLELDELESEVGQVSAFVLAVEAVSREIGEDIRRPDGDLHLLVPLLDLL